MIAAEFTKNSQARSKFPKTIARYAGISGSQSRPRQSRSKSLAAIFLSHWWRGRKFAASLLPLSSPRLVGLLLLVPRTLRASVLANFS